METTLASNFLNQDIQVRCVAGALYEGELTSVNNSVAVLEWEGKTTFIACDKIVAAWLRDPKQKHTPTIGFLGA
jgi:hypothetical protein